MQRRKVSGSAYRETMDCGFIFGTLLSTPIKPSLSILSGRPEKQWAKGITFSADGWRSGCCCRALPISKVCEAIQEATSAVTANGWTPGVIPGQHAGSTNFAETFARKSSME